MSHDEIREQVKDRYAALARKVGVAPRQGCCGGAGGCGGGAEDPITRDLYSASEAGQVPGHALEASLGCGNPTALAELVPGETVLDLGSGGGIDVLLSARRVGPTGKAYGLDMTPEMLELARRNAAQAGVTNVEFLQGTIEHIPLPDASVDVIISNCVINLSADKDQVLREAYRVLKPGGRFAVSDIVLRRPLPPALAASVAAWTGCVAGALLETEYTNKLAATGFAEIGVEPTRVYTEEDAGPLLAAYAPDVPLGAAEIAALDGAVISAFVRAKKPTR
ncbi:MAG: arsenite methyltransferase [Deltaproteobacteria bacterium]|nr:arsenite methyltransferase [Deltaproteobacteria bacterium]